MKKKCILYTGLNPAHYESQNEIIHFPLIRIVPHSFDLSDIVHAFKRFFDYSHVIITSKSAIPILLDAMHFFGYSIDDWKKKVTIAVGRVTTYYLNKVGIIPSIIASEETAEGVIQAINPLELHKHYFFWPHSAQARSVIPDFFKEKEVSFAQCSLYSTLPIELSQVPDLDQFDEIVFTSPSGVKAFFQIFGMIPDGKTVSCIGPVTQHILDETEKRVKKILTK